jgi:hypothetical protein
VWDSAFGLGFGKTKEEKTLRGNPVFHDYPPNPLPAERMHRELHMSRHADCTPETCAMIRYCRGRLIELGRLKSDDAPGECSACRAEPNRSTLA